MRGRRRSNQRTEQTSKTVMRCQKHMRPVFETDVCKDFISKESTDNVKKCKNCKNSF